MSAQDTVQDLQSLKSHHCYMGALQGLWSSWCMSKPQGCLKVFYLSKVADLPVDDFNTVRSQ